jgi:endo-1,4-beta-xylanase
MIGTAFNGDRDLRYRDLVRRQMGLLVHEWSLKPGFLKPDRDAPVRFEEADGIYAFARDAGLAIHGHTLFWHGDPLKWVTSEADARRAYLALLAQVMGRYPQTISWDVANEVIADPGTLWRDQAPIRDEAGFVAALFREAGRLAPGRELCLNDYNLECGRDWCSLKRARMLSVLDDLRNRGAPVTAVGLQSHLSSKHGLDLTELTRFIREIGDRGLRVYISELDVNDVSFPDDTKQRDAAVAAMYREYLEAVLSEPAVKRVVFWGLSDRDHWLVRGDVDDARPAGESRPGLFDRQLNPKPAFWAVLEALQAAPPR